MTGYREPSGTLQSGSTGEVDCDPADDQIVRLIES